MAGDSRRRKEEGEERDDDDDDDDDVDDELGKQKVFSTLDLTPLKMEIRTRIPKIQNLTRMTELFVTEDFANKRCGHVEDIMCLINISRTRNIFWNTLFEYRHIMTSDLDNGYYLTHAYMNL